MLLAQGSCLWAPSQPQPGPWGVLGSPTPGCWVIHEGAQQPPPGRALGPGASSPLKAQWAPALRAESESLSASLSWWPGAPPAGASGRRAAACGSRVHCIHMWSVYSGLSLGARQPSSPWRGMASKLMPAKALSYFPCGSSAKPELLLKPNKLTVSNFKDRHS